ncbi:heparanase [Holotrichia oblita]|uniref:Heparanase n=1 Tax=Holotrichia oblita TaxID=644536 RepID=A0ACB9T8A1_HOLOL|nr:heparanase [Holotrichia oblita]
MNAAATNKCKMQLSTTVALLFLGFLLVSVITVSLHPPVKPVHIVLVQTNAPANHVTSTRFLSIALDSSIIADGFSRFDMRNRRLRKMMTNLSPGYLRIGDTEWLELYELSFNTGFTILFDLNVLIRKADGSWDYENAEKLIKFSNDNNMNVIWQLGNGGVTGAEMKDILEQTVKWLQNIGFSVRATVCDQSTANQWVVRKLGVTEEKPYFLLNVKKFMSYLMCLTLLRVRTLNDGNEFKCALSDQHKVVEETMREAITWISTWSIRETKNPPCFNGLRLSLTSLLYLWSDFKTEEYKFMLTCRFNQDPLEHFFGKIRSMNGYNPNPTTRLFRRNCEADDIHTRDTNLLCDANNLSNVINTPETSNTVCISNFFLTEPNSFEHVFNYAVNASQLARDFRRLREILNKYPLYRNVLMIGPDVTRPRPDDTNSIAYLNEFLAVGGGNVVNAVTFHQSVCTSLILAETSDAYGGGAPGYSNRYIGTFIWLDKLGISAKMGLDVVVRQTLFKGFYALIDNNYDPTPNYWISVIYKAFVGPEVVPCIEASSEKVRLYCQCTNKNFRSSSVTLFGFNLKDSDVIIRVEGLKDPRHALDTIYAYVLSPYLTLFTKSMYLNKEQLVLGSDGTLPPFKPKLITDEVHVVIPAYSSAFFVIPTDIAACH